MTNGVYLGVASFIGGIFLARHLPLRPFPLLLLLMMVLTLSAVTAAFRRERRVLIAGTCVILFLLGFWRYQSVIPNVDATWVQSLNDGPAVTLTGQITRDPEVFGGFQRIRVGKLNRQNRSLKGSVLVKTRRYPSYHYGDRLQITGKLATPPEFNDFSYRDYLAAQGIYARLNYPEVTRVGGDGGNRLYQALLSFRHRLELRISEILPEPEASLLAGVLLGVKRHLPPDFYTALQKSGTLHVVVVSGQNITYVILAMLGLGSLFFTTSTYRVLLAATGLLAYALMVGGDAAVWRATLMGLALLFASFWGRLKIARQTLFLSAAVLLAINPPSLWQVGFELSFTATAGIIFLQDMIKDRLQVVPKFLREGLVTTLAAQLAVLPVLAHNFQSLSLISPLSNLLIFWLVPLITTLGGLTALISLFFLPGGRLMSWVLFVPLKAFVAIVELTAKIPLAQVDLPKVPVLVWVSYYLILIFLIFRHDRD